MLAQLVFRPEQPVVVSLVRAVLTISLQISLCHNSRQNDKSDPQYIEH